MVSMQCVEGQNALLFAGVEYPDAASVEEAKAPFLEKSASSRDFQNLLLGTRDPGEHE